MGQTNPLYEQWEVAYEDFYIEIRKNPKSIRDYVGNLKDSGKCLRFPKEDLEKIALTNKEEGEKIIKGLIPFIDRKLFFEDTQVTYDTIIAAVTKVYLQREMQRKNQ